MHEHKKRDYTIQDPEGRIKDQQARFREYLLLDRVREARGWSIPKWAEEAGITRQAMDAMTRETTAPSTAMLKKLRGALRLAKSAQLAPVARGGDYLALVNRLRPVIVTVLLTLMRRLLAGEYRLDGVDDEELQQRHKAFFVEMDARLAARLIAEAMQAATFAISMLGGATESPWIGVQDVARWRSAMATLLLRPHSPNRIECMKEALSIRESETRGDFLFAVMNGVFQVLGEEIRDHDPAVIIGQVLEQIEAAETLEGAKQAVQGCADLYPMEQLNLMPTSWTVDDEEEVRRDHVIAVDSGRQG